MSDRGRTTLDNRAYSPLQTNIINCNTILHLAETLILTQYMVIHNCWIKWYNEDEGKGNVDLHSA